MYLTLTIQLSIICIIQSAALPDTQACSGCCTSAAGIPGIPGTHGNPGIPGPLGLKGDVGMKGGDGRQGVPGKMGPIGLPGASIPGPVGIKGDVGVKGQDGRQGVPGKMGPIGLPGAGIPGPVGVRGEIGPTGLSGGTGEKGERGEKGEQATTNSQPKSAFSVAFATDPGRLAVAPMKYETIITNLGSHYNKETGKFVCQHPGTYVFQFTSQSSSGGNIATRIMKNGQLIVSSLESGSGYNSISNMIVVDLVVDDQVWTQPHSTSYNYYYSNSNSYCTFSGFLLYASS